VPRRWNAQGQPIEDAAPGAVAGSVVPAPDAAPARRWDAQGQAITAPPPPASPQRTPSQQRAYEHERDTSIDQTVDPRAAMFVRGLSGGGWADEIDANVEGAMTSLQNAGRRVMGRPIPFTGREAHDAALEVNRETERRYRAQNPGVLGIDPYEMAGEFFLPWGKLNRGLRAAGVSSPALRAILLGAGAGAESGSGSADTDDVGERVAAGGRGALGGALTAGALHGTGRILSASPVARIGGALSEAMSRIRDNFGREPGAPPTPAQAARGERLGTEMVRQMANRSDPTGQNLAANPLEQRGAPITSAEAMGRNAQTALKVAGRRQGATPDALESMLADRANETPQRIVQDFAEITGLDPAEIGGDFTAQTARLRAQARPFYDRAYGYNEPVINDTLRRLMTRPSVRNAITRAERIAEEEGIDPRMVGIVRDAAGNPQMSESPTLRTWDYVKRGLDDVMEGYRDPTTRRLNLDTEGRAVQDTLSRLRDALTDSDTGWGPAYARALQAGGEPLRLEGAFTAAKTLMSNTTAEREFNSRIAQMGEAEMEALRAGIVADVRTRAMAGRQRLGDMLTRSYEQKLMRVFGEDRGRQLIQRIQDERFLLTHGRRMQPGIGSDTSETQMGNQEQQESMRTAGRAAYHAVHGRGVSALMELAGDPIMGLMRGAQMPVDEATRDAMGRLLMLPPSELSQVLREYAASRGTPFLTDPQVQQLIERMSVAAKSTAAIQSQRQAPPSPYRSEALNQALSSGP